MHAVYVGLGSERTMEAYNLETLCISFPTVSFNLRTFSPTLTQRDKRLDRVITLVSHMEDLCGEGV